MTAIVAQVTYGQLINHASDDDTHITGKSFGHTLYAANWVVSVLALFALVLWYQLFIGNSVKRAATIDTTSYPRARATGAESPISARAFMESPVRQRPSSKWSHN